MGKLTWSLSISMLFIGRFCCFVLFCFHGIFVEAESVCSPRLLQIHNPPVSASWVMAYRHAACARLASFTPLSRSLVSSLSFPCCVGFWRLPRVLLVPFSVGIPSLWQKFSALFLVWICAWAARSDENAFETGQEHTGEHIRHVIIWSYCGILGVFGCAPTPWLDTAMLG